MIVEIDPASPVPPYEQIREQIVAMIGGGVLERGTRLPSIRQLATDLGLANGTVARAYRELEASGHLRSRVGQGTVVAEVPALPAAERTDRLRRAARSFATTVRQLGVDPETALREARRQLNES